MVTSQGQVIMLLVVLGAGFIIGAALAWWLANRANNPPVDQEQDMFVELRKRYTEKAALLQDRSSGQLVVRSGGQLISTVNQMTEAQKKSMNGLLKEWAGWMGFTGIQTDPPAGSIESRLQTVLAAPPPATAVPVSTANLEEGVEEKAAVIPAAVKPKSIVEQINEILQENLKGHSALSKGIRLAEDPRQGVIVWVGLEHFVGVDSVPDPEVKAIVKEAVMEWERRTQPGKNL